MNNFTKIVFGSCVGFAVAFIALGALFFVFVIGMASTGGGKHKTSVKENSVLHLTFDQPVPEQTNNLEMDPFKFDEEILGLHAIVDAIEHAAQDEDIKGIYLNPEEGLRMGLTEAHILRNAILKFKESGKFVTAYSKSYSQGAYYLASLSDKVFLNPMGNIDFYGYAATVPYFKNMLDKIGVEMQVIYVGDFKGGSEPYRLTEMSDSNRLQLRQYLEPVYQNILRDIGASRGKSVGELRAMADGLKIRTPNDAVAFGLADQVAHLDEVITDLKERMGLDDDDKLNTVSIGTYAHSYTPKKHSGKDRVAVVFAEGTILHNQGERGTIVDDDYVKLLRKIRNDKKIKAVVLRVNSPGGSALASENIWRELKLIQDAGKPLVVSMGNYAASGGYYISCMADKIYAEENTLAGSIGVYMMLPNMNELFAEKLGIDFDTVKTAQHSTGINTIYDLDPTQEDYLRASTENVYDIFLKRVADGRNMDTSVVAKLAKGRIYIAPRAKEIGLVDEIGGLEDAIASAVEMAGLDKYRTKEYPIQPDPMTELINQLTGQGDNDGIRQSILDRELGTRYSFFKQIKEMVMMKGVQARLPVLIEFN